MSRRWRKRAIQLRNNRRLSVIAPVALVAVVLIALTAVVVSGGSDEEQTAPAPERTRPPIGGEPSSPSPETATPTPGVEPFQYEVQEGDTLLAIAQQFGVTVEELIAANPGIDPEALQIGEVLVISGVGFQPPPTPVRPENPFGTGWLIPIEGACLPQAANLLPNAPRAYRFGVHEGMDFYSWDNCVDVPPDEPVLAAKAGTVIRADHDFVEMTEAELNELLARSEAQGYTDAEALDRFRGRQVWIDHGGGIVSRYAHLSGIPEDIQAGTEVEQGRVVGYVGDSGTPEAVTNPGLEIHRHFELWHGDSFLGEGLPIEQVRMLLEEVFGE